MMKYLLIAVVLLLTTNSFSQRQPYDQITEKNGKIGIGTSFPDELLTVKGKVHTQEVLVDLNGAVAPDYVFEYFFTGHSPSKEGYRLRSIRELESYLARNHHLPGIPSATELSRNGIPLKEMNLKLLEKIEELTLYTLKQQSEIDELREEITRLKNE